MAPSGPALLVYYNPALLQKAQDFPFALRTMYEIYRAARKLWPLDPEQENLTVTIRIDNIKEKAVHACRSVTYRFLCPTRQVRTGHERACDITAFL